MPCRSSCPATQFAVEFLRATSLPQIGYGATILSFLGGVHWGLAMTNVGGEACCHWLGWCVKRRTKLGCGAVQLNVLREDDVPEIIATFLVHVPVQTAGDTAFKMADQRYLWSVVPCLMGWPTVAMPLAHAAGIQVQRGCCQCCF